MTVIVDGVLGHLRLARHTWRCPCISVVPEATHEASRGPEKSALSAEKALGGSETETRELLGGTEENSVPWWGVIEICPPGKSIIISQKGNKKIKLVARPPWSNPSNLKSVVGQKAVSGDLVGLVSHVSEIRCVPYGQVHSAQQELHCLLSQPILTRIMPEKGSYRGKNYYHH